MHTVLEASPAQVWADLADIASHVEWMLDAEAIRFEGSRRSGVGTRFACETRVGPLRLTDRMEVTSWVPGREMGVHHHGVVTGVGRFRLSPARGGRTRFAWTEQLRFPWWMGGPLGATVAWPVLRRVWRANLTRLARRFDTGPARAAGPARAGDPA